MKLFAAILTLATTAPAFAATIDVNILRCQSAEVKADGSVRTSQAFLIGNSTTSEQLGIPATSENENGKLEIRLREHAGLLVVKATFVGVDGKKLVIENGTTLGAQTSAQTLNCATKDDVGRLGVMLSISN